MTLEEAGGAGGTGQEHREGGLGREVAVGDTRRQCRVEVSSPSPGAPILPGFHSGSLDSHLRSPSLPALASQANKCVEKPRQSSLWMGPEASLWGRKGVNELATSATGWKSPWEGLAGAECPLGFGGFSKPSWRMRGGSSSYIPHERGTVATVVCVVAVVFSVK